MEQKAKKDKYMYVVFTLTTLGWMFDALDQMIYAMVAPWIMKDWSLSTVELGLIGSIFLLGNATGSVVGSIFADIYGRKPLLWISALVYSGFTGLAGFAQGMSSLAAIRALTGLGTGAQWPVGISMFSEYVPAEKRGRWVGIMNSGYPIGFLLSIGVTSTVGLYFRDSLGDWAWRLCFFVGAVPGIIIMFFMIKYLKESAVWLRDQAAQKAKEKKKSSVAYFDLFKPKLIKNTMTALILQIAALMSYWGMALWAPTFLATQRGLTIAKMTGFMALWVFGAWVGQIAGGFLSDKFGRKPVLSAYLLGIAVSSIAYAYVTSPVMLLLVNPITGFFVFGIFGPAMGYTSELFPTSLRASGVGFAVGFGRIGAIIAPSLVGVIAAHFSIGAGFYVFSAVGIVGFFLVLILGPETKGIQFEEDQQVETSKALPEEA
jgi:MFS transporter, putative metabolite:H+ symporter